ncbi:hypothetical protein [Desulfothermus naphthae]
MEMLLLMARVKNRGNCLCGGIYVPAGKESIHRSSKKIPAPKQSSISWTKKTNRSDIVIGRSTSPIGKRNLVNEKRPKKNYRKIDL